MGAVGGLAQEAKRKCVGFTATVLREEHPPPFLSLLPGVHIALTPMPVRETLDPRVAVPCLVSVERLPQGLVRGA